MKKLIYLLSITMALLFAFTFNVKAATYRANEMIYGQQIHTGDILEFGSWDNCDIVKVVYDLNYNYESNPLYQIRPNQTFIFDHDCFFNEYLEGSRSAGNNVTRWKTLVFTTVRCDLLYNGSPVPYRLEIKPGETKRIYLSYEGGSEPLTIKYVGIPFPYTKPTQEIELHPSSNFIDVNYGEYDQIYVAFYCPTGKGRDNLAGQCSVFMTYPNDNVSQNSDDSNTPGNNESDSPQTPSTIPNGVSQITLDSNGTYTNIKALNQFSHDSLNQKILADLYAAKSGKKANVLIQKNVIPPWGVKNDWKASSHTVRWKDLNVKKGDKVIVVWYTPSYQKYGATLQFITATVVEDGIIEFTIPAMGDMSVMSIVKLY